jgi:DNA-binding NarL/FixJ family response regulator
MEQMTLTAERTRGSVSPGSKPRTRVILVDDHPFLRQGVARLISAQADMVVCGVAEDCESAIVDLTLKNDNGVDLIRRLLARWPKLAVLVLSMHDDPFYAERALRAGAHGYITKGESCEQLLDGIRQVRAGEVFVGEQMAGRMVNKIVGGKGIGELQSVERLSERELEVFELIGHGVSTREIAAKLKLSAKTVDAHRQNIKDKLRLPNAMALLRTAIQWVEFQHGS